MLRELFSLSPAWEPMHLMAWERTTAHSREEVCKRSPREGGGEAKLDIKEELELECKGWGKEWGLAKPSVVDGV